MTILVTGATGFVGLNVVEQLLTRGSDVATLSAKAFPASVLTAFEALPGTLTAFDGDVRDRDLVRRILSECQVTHVLHGAVITSNAAREKQTPEEILSVNLGGLASVLTASAEAGVKRFVAVSSIGVFGTAPADGESLTEDRPHTPATLYGITKSAGEAIVERLAALHGLDCINARLGVVFGPYEYATGLRDTMSPLHVITGIARAGGTATLPRAAVKNWQYSRDAAGSLITLLDTPEHRFNTYNLGPEAVWRLADWCKLLAEKFTAFRWSIDPAASGERVGLWNPRDGGVLSGERFLNEFGPTARFGVELAFEDYMRFLDSEPGTDFRP